MATAKERSLGRRARSAPQLVRSDSSRRSLVSRRNSKAFWILTLTLSAGICFSVAVVTVLLTSLTMMEEGNGGEGGIFSRKVTSAQEIFTPIQQQQERRHNPRNETQQRVSDNWYRDPLAIFYNIYIPDSSAQSDVTDAVDIVKEQIQQITASPACRQPLTLYYNVIGNAKALNTTTMQQICKENSRNLRCQRMHEYETASETVTLQQLHRFCQNHDDYRVTYLHTKGSFHVSDKNTHWRRLLTAAAISADCVNPPNSTCNLCGLQFFTQFTFFIPGNMFTADCRYVKKLLPLDQYKISHEQAIKSILLLRLRNQLRATLIWDQRDYYGLDRYSDEHWIGSHPDVVPCDMDPVGNLSNVFHGILEEESFDWAMGPRNSGICGGINDHLQPVVRSNPHLRYREVLLLPGLLVKWLAMYGRAPAANSWIWQYFPDGGMWREAVEEYGADAVEVVTAPYYVSVDGSRLRSAFAPDNSLITTSANQTTDTDPTSEYWNSNLTLDNNTSSDYVIFYHIAVPNEKDGSGSVFGQAGSDQEMRETERFVKEQLKIVGSSYAASQKPVKLFYTVAGQDSKAPTHAEEMTRLVSKICAAETNLSCQPMLQFDQNYEGETLRQLHRFCKVNPSYRASYIHNQGPMQIRNNGGNGKLIRHMTMAVTSQQCLKPEKDSCNVCGLIFYSLWTFFFPGNIFATSCEYVNRLLPPESFELRMNEFIGSMLLQRLRSKITSNLFTDRADYFGLDRYAIEHWIGSHPSFEPCDLTDASKGLEYWREKDRPISAFNWSDIPRQKDAPFGMILSMKPKVLASENLRRREYFFLAGQLLKWYTLYDKAPQPFSWAWWHNQDGLLWLKGNHDYGAGVVDELTSEYAVDSF